MKPIFKKNDYYSRLAKREHYPARSVYKLEQINMKYKVLKARDRVLDLGCTPGSWLLFLAEKIGPEGKVIGVDVQDIQIKIPKNAEFIKIDIMDFKIDREFDLIVSDLAPNTTGIHFADAEKSLEFCEKALEIVKTNLKKGGNFVCKIYEGEGTQGFFKKVEQNFEIAKRYRPMAVRRESREIYIIGKNYGTN